VLQQRASPYVIVEHYTKYMLKLCSLIQRHKSTLKFTCDAPEKLSALLFVSDCSKTKHKVTAAGSYDDFFHIKDGKYFHFTSCLILFFLLFLTL